jgi:NADH/F420H2 dehydrogenase subunit C
MKQAQITARVQAHMGERIVEVWDQHGQQAVVVGPDALLPLLQFLRSDPELSFEMLMDISGVDYIDHPFDKDWRFEVVYQLYSLSKNHRYRVKVAVEDDTISVPTAWHMWRTANWMEREVWDQYGVKFAGHGNLRRILNHDDFVGHPLRKDYPINKRQKLARPVDNLMPDDPEWA